MRNTRRCNAAKVVDSELSDNCRWLQGKQSNREGIQQPRRQASSNRLSRVFALCKFFLRARDVPSRPSQQNVQKCFFFCALAIFPEKPRTRYGQLQFSRAPILCPAVIELYDVCRTVCWTELLSRHKIIYGP